MCLANWKMSCLVSHHICRLISIRFKKCFQSAHSFSYQYLVWDHGSSSLLFVDEILADETQAEMFMNKQKQ